MVIKPQEVPEDIISPALESIYGYVIGISSALAVVALAVCAIRYMAAGDARTASQIMDDGKQVIAAWILLNLLGLIISTALSLISGISI